MNVETETLEKIPGITREIDAHMEEEIDGLFSSSLYLHNDDFNTFNHVIECLIAYCDHQQLQAEQCALIVHNNGKCEVKRGSRKKLKPILESLLENGLTATIE